MGRMDVERTIIENLMRKKSQKGTDKTVGVKLECKNTVSNICCISRSHWQIIGELQFVGQQINFN